MKKIILFLFAVILFSACSVTKHRSSIIGQFSGQAFWSTMTLSLNPDETFNINWNYDYTGRWEILDSKHILLKFDEITNPEILLSSGTLTGEDIKVKFVNKDKVIMLPYKKRVLMRQRP